LQGRKIGKEITIVADVILSKPQDKKRSSSREKEKTLQL
jgi:hypothetical protein